MEMTVDFVERISLKLDHLCHAERITRRRVHRLETQFRILGFAEACTVLALYLAVLKIEEQNNTIKKLQKEPEQGESNKEG